MISTRNLKELPDIDELKKILQSLSIIGAIFSANDNWYGGFYFINPNIACYDNLQGDRFDVFFYENIGAVIIGFYHYSSMSPYGPDGENRGIWSGVIDKVPDEFNEKIISDHFEDTNNYKLITFCIWKKYTDKIWNIGNIDFPPGDDPDGSEYLLKFLNYNREEYLEWVRDDYLDGFEEEEKDERINLDIINHIFDHKPLTEEIVQKLNPEATLEGIREEIIKIGYPIA